MPTDRLRQRVDRRAHGAALTTAHLWRQMFQQLSQFTTQTRGRHLISHAQQFRTLTEQLLRASIHGNTATTWVPVVQAMTTDLADTAHTLGRIFATKVDTGDLLLPFDPGTRGREHLFRTVRPTDQPVLRLRKAADDTHRSTRELARTLHDLDPAAHPNPTRARKLWRRPAPDPQATPDPRPDPGTASPRSLRPPPAPARRR